jgi:hypothetical protein
MHYILCSHNRIAYLLNITHYNPLLNTTNSSSVETLEDPEGMFACPCYPPFWSGLMDSWVLEPSELATSDLCL